MKTQLILLDTPIIVSDEEIKEGNWCIDKSNCIYKQETDKVFEIFTGARKIIAGIPELPSIDFNGFEEQLGIIDVEKLAIDEVDGTIENDIDNIYCNGFIEGFKAAQKLNKNKFSLEDIKEAIHLTRNLRKLNITLKTNILELHEYENKQVEEIISKLSQPKVFDVEIETETKWFNSRFGGSWQPFPDATSTISEKFPKVINNKIKIIKIL